jgi:two-component system NtrC family sensor kinase
VSRYDERAGGVVVKVEDNGPGIAEDIRSRIFEPFFTTKEVGTGTGIGLAFCHRIIEAHGGTIRVASRPGVYTAFFVRLPATPRARPAEIGEPAVAASGLSVLVIDDEPDVADLIAEVLRGEGHGVSVANSGEQALEQMAKRPFGLILSDLNMPRLSGAELHERLSAANPEFVSRLAFITGDTMSSKTRDFLDGSGRPCLEKPIRPDALRHLVAAFARRC